jgi:putative Holliday junction resolvase
MKKISALGLDIGSKRVGVAGCDGIGLIATGLTTVTRTSFANDVEQFKQLVTQREADILVVGLPYSMNGLIGTQAKQVQKYAQRLAITLELPLEYVDERLTSVEAEEQLKSQKRFSSRDKGAIDRQAATIILQQWLDQRRASGSQSIYNKSL